MRIHAVSADRDDFVIYVVNSEQDYQRYTLKELLPFGFGGDAIR